MSLAHFMNARKCDHAQKPYSCQALNQAWSEEEEKREVEMIHERQRPEG